MFKFLKKVFGKKNSGLVLSYEDFERLICGLNSVSSKLEALYNNKLSGDLEEDEVFKEAYSRKQIEMFKTTKLIGEIDYNGRHVNVKRVYSEEMREDVYWVHFNYFYKMSEEYEELNKCLEHDGLLPDFTISLNDAVKQFRIISSLPESCDSINCDIDYIKKIYDRLMVGNEMLRECLDWNKNNNYKLNVNIIRRGGAFAEASN